MGRIVLVFLLLSILFGLTAFDRSAAGEALRRALVQAPARMLGWLTRGRAVGFLLVALLMLVATVMFEAEGLKLASMAAPDLIGWVLMFDVTVLFDLMVLAVSLKALAGWRGVTHVATALRRRTRRLIARLGARRGRGPRKPRRPRPPRPGSDEAEPDLVFA
ncbi:hypothetical protein [Brevundimonas sp.]|uniref:hypothetical protein n=1 Tax=Brevundimonas sp. TaxID=1871086 RepID=UPI0028987388|nr:hypothetical protein [Brevundimonas sp.]